LKTLIGGIILIFSYWIYPGITYAQKQHILELGSGVYQQNTINKLISPLTYRGMSMPINVDYRVIKSKYVMVIGGNFSLQKLTSNITNASQHFQNEIGAELYFGYMRKINTFSSKRFHFYAGAYHDILFTFQDQHYDQDSEEDFVNVAVSLIEAALGYRYALNPRQTLSQNINITLVGLNFRTPYYGLRTDPNMYLEFPNDNLKITHQISYAYRLGKHLSIGLRYRFLYRTYKRPFKFYSLTNHYLVTLGVHL